MPPARKQNMKQKQYCDKFNKDFKDSPHQKKVLKNRELDKEYKQEFHRKM